MDRTHALNRLEFTTTAGSVAADDLRVHEMHGIQQLSTLYEFKLSMHCTIDGGLGPDSIAELLDSSCSIGFGPEATQRASGVLREIELVEIEHAAARATYEAVLVPRLWLATLTRRSRVFMDKSIPEVIQAVLGDIGLSQGNDFELRLVASYSPRDYVVQYEETDFDFISRWMERVGIFYFFEQGEEREKLILADANSATSAAVEHGECIHAPTSEQGVLGAVHGLRRRSRRMPVSIECRDYNWRTPATPVRGSADVDADHGAGVQTYYGDHFRTDAEGATAARLRAEALNATKHVYSASSVNADFAPGCRVTVSGSPVGELDIEYLITRVEHRSIDAPSGGSSTYRNDFQAIAADVPYRAPRVTPWPRIDGVVQAKIDAESVSSAAPVNQEGMYRVVMPYDNYGAFGGRATRWIRKAEPYAGPQYGMHFTLHVGTEVLLAHVCGDPDRPLIVGSVPNPATASPMSTAHATRSAIRTRSGILIDFEDDA